ncbi:ELWxxDGT repeat protein, partial [Fluviicola sp.]|uniref:ELWxxDGT repeat protein n=1 Tax=Fluviicola sp. TaxID=1917219 RepID=UPI00262DA065
MNLNKTKSSLFFILLMSFIQSVSYGQVSLVKDINQTAANLTNSDPSDFTVSNNKLFFIAETEWISNRMVWVSDGTVAGTKPLLNTLLPSSLKDVNNTLYFIGYDAAHGYELWKSDGTEAGTMMVKDIKPGNDNSNISFVGELNGELYFRASANSSNLHYLWKTDGTEAGTVVAEQALCSGGEGAVLNGKLYYSAIGWPFLLYATDGTPGGATQISSAVESPLEITKYGNKLVFFGENYATGKEIWCSDGTSAGTILLKDIYAGSTGSSPTGLTLFNNELYFPATGNINGFEIWKTNGTSAGTTLAIELIPGATGSNFISKIMENNGELIFLARDAGNLMNLYKSDGTTAGTQSIMTFPGVTVPTLLTKNNGEIYFVFNNGSSTSAQLWKTNGTAAGTVLLKTLNFPQIYQGVASMGTFNNTIYFGGSDATYGRELWHCDGTTTGTTLFKDLNSPTHSRPRLLTAVGNELFFVADSGNVENYLFKSDGTAAGTTMIKNINTIGQEPQYEMVAYNGKALFGKQGIPGDDDLFVSDGTAAGTHSVKDLQSGYTYPYAYTEMNGIMYFVTKYSNADWLYRTDGTTAGTTQVYTGSLGSASTGSYVLDDRLKRLDNNLYFRGADGELWKSDGTNAGTQLLKNINTNPSQGSDPRQFKVCNNQLFFIANDATGSNRLWKTDGTAAGTVAVGTGEASPALALNNNLLILASPTVSQQTLSLYNTSTGIRTTLQTWSGYSNNIGKFTSLDSIVLFTVKGVIWKTNGVTASIVKDTRSTPTSDGPESFTRVGDFLYFIQYDLAGHKQLWRTNGTTCGTNRITQFGGAYNTIITDLEVMGGDVYFSAYTHEYSHELWKFNVVPPIDTFINDTICPNTTLTWNNITLQSTGSYCQSFTTSIGLDSIVHLNLVVDATPTNTIDN